MPHTLPVLHCLPTTRGGAPPRRPSSPVYETAGRTGPPLRRCAAVDGKVDLVGGGLARRDDLCHGLDALFRRGDSDIDLLLGVLGGDEPALELAGVEVDAALLHLLVPGAVDVVAHVGHGIAIVVEAILRRIAEEDLEERPHALIEAVVAGLADHADQPGP